MWEVCYRLSPIVLGLWVALTTPVGWPGEIWIGTAALIWPWEIGMEVGCTTTSAMGVYFLLLAMT